jgi:hypothetical protein
MVYGDRGEHLVAGVSLCALTKDGFGALFLEHLACAVRGSHVADCHDGVPLRVSRAMAHHRQQRVNGCAHRHVVSLARCFFFSRITPSALASRRMRACSDLYV